MLRRSRLLRRNNRLRRWRRFPNSTVSGNQYTGSADISAVLSNVAVTGVLAEAGSIDVAAVQSALAVTAALSEIGSADIAATQSAITTTGVLAEHGLVDVAAVQSAIAATGALAERGTVDIAATQSAIAAAGSIQGAVLPVPPIAPPFTSGGPPYRPKAKPSRIVVVPNLVHDWQALQTLHAEGELDEEEFAALLEDELVGASR